MDSKGSSPSPAAFPKVVVVGAGIAGLTVTKELRRRGWPSDRVVLLEATSTVGGRMRTRQHPSGFLYDAGAAYVHGTTGNPIAKLAKEANITLKQASTNNPWIEGSSSVALYVRGARATEAERIKTDKAFSDLMGIVMTRANACGDPYVMLSDVVAEILVAERFDSLPTAEKARLHLRLMTMALWYGCDLSDLQLLEFSSDGNDDLSFHGQVLECLRLNSPVETIVTRRRGEVSPLSTVDRRVSAATRYGLSVGEKDEGLPPVTSNGSATATGQVAVEEVSISLTDTVARGESGGIQADAAVVTVPLSLLQKGIITFDPPLPENARSAMSRLRLGCYEKIIMEFREAFWPADVPFIGCCPENATLPSASLRDAPDTTTDPLPVAPVFLENYLWSKGVPVLAAAVSGQRAQRVCRGCLEAPTSPATGIGSNTSADLVDAPEADATGVETRTFELYRQLVLPALKDSFFDCCHEGDIPKPVSVVITGWADEPCQRGSYSFFPLGAQQDDIYMAGQGIASNSAGVPESPCRVFLAGEATSVEYEGSMHGAYLSGVRAAEDVAYAFSRSSRETVA